MQFDQIIATATDFYQAHQLLSVIILVTVVCFLYQSPKETFKFLLFLAVLAIAGYFVVQLGSSTDSSVKAKEELTNKSKKAIGE